MRRAIARIQNTNVHAPRTMRGAIPRPQNLRFTTVSRDRPTESYERVHPAKSKCAFRYSGVPFAPAACNKMYETSAGNPRYLAAYKNHRFTCPSSSKICISPQSWTSDEHEVTRGLCEDTENLHFTTVLGVRRSLFA